MVVLFVPRSSCGRKFLRLVLDLFGKHFLSLAPNGWSWNLLQGVPVAPVWYQGVQGPGY